MSIKQPLLDDYFVARKYEFTLPDLRGVFR